MAGATIGVEEEYFLVDPETGALAARPELVAAAAAGKFGPRVQAELQTAQLEIATGICTNIADLHADLEQARAAATLAARAEGAALLATGTHPFATWRELAMVEKDRYLALRRRFERLSRQQLISGCHVHVAIPDLESAVQVSDHARPWLPILLALTASSPFHDGADTGYVSWRTQAWSLWPHAGCPPVFGSTSNYLDTVAALIEADVIDDPSNLYWSIRPSLRYPTLEFRIADVCTDIDDALLHAALVRSLVRTLAGRAAAGVPAPAVSDQALRVAVWRAARWGVTGRLVDPTTGRLVDGMVAVRRLLRLLETDLAEHGELDLVSARVALVLRRGTSAARQRAIYGSTQDLSEVVRAMTFETEPMDTTATARIGA
jgi:carboxylate-amine ligase